MGWLTRVFATGVTAVTVVAVVLFNSPMAHGDNVSFMAYLHDHGYSGRYQGGAPVNLERTILFGIMACTNLHNGMSVPEQTPRYWVLPEFPLVAEAAQHELCPDTLGRD